jgi:hypothetical protein
MQSQDALPMAALDGDEAHRRSAGRFTDRLGIGAVGLVPLDERFHVLRRNHPHFVSVFGYLPRPEMRGETGFERDQSRREADEKREDLASSDLPLEHTGAVGVGAVNLKYVCESASEFDPSLFRQVNDLPRRSAFGPHAE